ncbi:MAG: hypothetical protein H0Z24_03415 [Thermosipho sp. (in: Bacteria)]|nr:hypothetical protein [Thermosipho sp. (in: thermotogales)]
MDSVDKKFLDIAFDKGFWAACKELNIPKEKWDYFKQLVKDNSCIICGIRVDLKGLCEDCQIEQTEFAREQGFIDM